MRTIQEIIERKKNGVDCTEAESAELKGWLREFRAVGEQWMEAEIQTLFPLEYDEYIAETELL